MFAERPLGSEAALSTCLTLHWWTDVVLSPDVKDVVFAHLVRLVAELTDELATEEKDQRYSSLYTRFKSHCNDGFGVD